MRYFFEVVPEGVFEAHGGLMPTNDNRTFNDSGFQGRSLKVFHKTFLAMIRAKPVGRKLPVKKLLQRCERLSSNKHRDTNLLA